MVASEVRALASRSASAAREIKVLINASLEKVASGTAQVDRIGEANRSVGQLDLMAHQNTALAEQSAAAAASLRQQASQLTELVSQFELGRPGTSEVAVRPHSISYSG